MKHASHCRADLLAIAFLCLSCSGDRPTDTVQETAAGRAHSAVGTVQGCVASASVTTAAQFKDALNNICDGGVISIPANTTIEFTGLAMPSVSNKSFTIEGANTTSVLHVHSMPSTDPVFIQASDIDHTHEVTIQNLKIIRDDGGTGLITLSAYENIEILDVTMEVEGDQYVLLNGKTVLVDGLDMTTAYASGLTLNTTPALGAFNYTIQNSTLEYTGVDDDGPVFAALNSNDGGTITWNDNNIIAAQSAHWYRLSGTLGAGVLIHMTDNDFGIRTIRVDVNNNVSGQLTFDLNCNNSNLASCPDVVIHPNNDVPVFYSHAPTWTLGYGACNPVGAITNQEACVFEGIAYVKFLVHHPQGFEPSMQVFARWSDDDCTTGYTDVPATHNPTTNRWVASFDVTGIADGSFYWKGMATLCSTTGSGTCEARSTRDCTGGHEPFISR